MNITRDQVQQLVAAVFRDIADQLDEKGITGDAKWRALRAAGPQIERCVVDSVCEMHEADLEARGAVRH